MTDFFLEPPPEDEEHPYRDTEVAIIEETEDSYLIEVLASDLHPVGARIWTLKRYVDTGDE